MRYTNVSYENWGWKLNSLLLFCICAPITAARIFQVPAQLDTTKHYDFIIIGGGTAGSVLASRLTENPKFNVLVVESGPTNQGVLNSIVPFFATRLEHSPWDWNFTTIPQAGLNGRAIDYPRGHILGGTSSINGMFYTRGSEDDYNRFARVTGDPGWSWKSILPFILKNEKWVPPADHHNTSGQFDPKVHNLNGNGMTEVSLPGFPKPIDNMVLQASKQLGGEFSLGPDMNAGRPHGLGWLQATIGHGARSSAATAYLGSEVMSRSNLDIVLETRVTRLVIDNGGMPFVKGVEVAKSASGPFTQIMASKEVLLCAGTVGTPHILMHSGIGDSQELAAAGVHTILNLSSVGRNLTDQPLLTGGWVANSTSPLDNINLNATLLAELLDQWEKTRTGPLVNLPPNQVAWLRLPENSPIFGQFDDPAAGPGTPHLELAFSNGGAIFPFMGTDPNQHSVGFRAAIVTPLSRGSIRINSSNPFDSPLIDPGLLQSPFDVFAMSQVVAAGRRFFAAPAWQGFALAEAEPLASATSEEGIENYMRQNAISTQHPVGTAAMSPRGASWGVVDPDLRVKGVSNIRIVDASVMPFVTCGHTQVPVYAIAERAADLIKADWK